jgi:hypothetical protein
VTAHRLELNRFERVLLVIALTIGGITLLLRLGTFGFLALSHLR